MAPDVDPKLSRAIAKGMASGEPVHAAFTLRNSREGTSLSPETTDRIVHELVSRAAREADVAARKLVVFKNLQSFSIDAPAALVEKLVADEAIGTAALGS